MIIGLNGQKGSGKDTVAAYLIKQHGFERKAFADPLKKSISALLDIPYHEIDKWKNDPRVAIEVAEYAHESDVGIHPHFSFINSFSFRTFLQRYGTESHRDVFGENFWVDVSLPLDANYVGRKIAVTDVRFPNEATRIKELGGYVVNIMRPGLPEKDPHRSEADLHEDLIDSFLMNVGTIEQLAVEIEEVLTFLLGKELPWSRPDADPAKDMKDTIQRSYERGIQ